MEQHLFDLNIELVTHNKKHCQNDYIVLSNNYPNSKKIHISITSMIEFISNLEQALTLSKESGDFSIVEPLANEDFYYSYSDNHIFKELKKIALEKDNIIFSQTPIKYIEPTNFFSIGYEDDYSVHFKNLNVSVRDMIKLKEYCEKLVKTHFYFKRKNVKKTLIS